MHLLVAVNTTAAAIAAATAATASTTAAASTALVPRLVHEITEARQHVYRAQLVVL